MEYIFHNIEKIYDNLTHRYHRFGKIFMISHDQSLHVFIPNIYATFRSNKHLSIFNSYIH